ncbi:efflux RND transporter periplasmic adaptor subunit [Tistrella mobilis]|uniref:efflux RND transporter periplasmic adaptor subunit n=1 Tax=Tistrella mobilis TaxID=171437 RepID=UPI003557A115
MSHPTATSRRRPAVLAAGILLFSAGVGIGHWSDRLIPQWPIAATDATPASIAVVRGTIERTISALGVVEPRVFVDVGTQVSGQLRAVHVGVGDAVTRGTLLAEIDPRIYETRVTGGEARLLNLEAQLRQAKAERDLARLREARIRRLFQHRAASREEADTSAANLAIAEAAIAAIDAQLREARSTLDGDRTNLSYTRILAPIDGTVVSQTSVVGQTLNANQTSPIILRLADLATMTVRAQVVEADVVRLAPGQPIRFSTLGRPDRVWHSRIRQILPTPQTLNDVVLYDVLIDVANPDGALMTSMTAQVFFVLDQAVDQPIIPLSALDRGTDGDRVHVRLADGRHEVRRVTIGLAARGRVAVTSGLDVGEIVLPIDAASAGMDPARVGNWGAGGRVPAAAGTE